MRGRSGVMLCLAVLGTSQCLGCAALSQEAIKPYHRPIASLAAPRALIYETVLALVRARGFGIVKADAVTGYIEALATPDAEIGEARERWTFVIGQRDLAIGLRLEARFDGPSGRWLTSNHVCRGYGYVREQEFIEAVALELDDHGHTVLIASDL